MTGLTSPTHLIIILLLALLLFGAKRLPEIGRSLGTGMREFKETVSGNDRPEPEQITQQPMTQQPMAQQPIAQQPIGTQDTTAPAPPREGETVG